MKLLRYGICALTLALVSLLWLAVTASAQSIQPIYFFTNGPATPYAGLTLGPDGNFYGTSKYGGIGSYNTGYGAVFKITADGAVSVVASFNKTNGANPEAGVTLGPDGSFYGTTSSGGSSGDGTIFNVTTNGTLTALISFVGSNGSNPQAELTFGPDGELYGTTYAGGTYSDGTVFKITTNGTLTTLLSFSGANGANPISTLTLGSNGNFYGTTSGGSGGNYGTIFQITSNGGFATVAAFAAFNGANPEAGLTLGPDGNFYGTTYHGGSNGMGTVFVLSTNGSPTYDDHTNILTLASFNNTNGASPHARLTLGPDGNFYGTTQNGGSNGYGTVFQITTNGVLTSLASFSGTNGENPGGALMPGSNGNFYGTTEASSSGYGTVFTVTTNGLLTNLVILPGTGGASPVAALTPGQEGDLYGTTSGGGDGNFGTAFKITTDGFLTTLVNFANDGANPVTGLVQDPDGVFYGTTYNGGPGAGTVFQMTTNGAFTILANFVYTNGVYTNGAGPYGTLARGPDGSYYGTTYGQYQGGVRGYGTVFKVTTDGTLTTLYTFSPTIQDGNLYTNTAGANPEAGLTLGPDGNFYGTASLGGSQGAGVIFKMTTEGELTPVVNFSDTNGFMPLSSLTLGPDGNFYGTTEEGGSAEWGTVFQMDTNGTLTTLATFEGTNGLDAIAGLALGPDGNFYGTTYYGGTGGGLGFGTVFRITTNGALTTLASFANSNGAYPYAGLTLGADGNFYGTTEQGGPGGGGVIYRLNLPPSITSQPASESVPVGGTAAFAVGAAGSPPLAYQWYFNTNTSMAGGVVAGLSFGPVQANEAGQYQVIVTNLYGSATSQVASLTVLLQPNCYGISNSGSGSLTLLLASTPGSTNRLWATTNLSLPLSQWQPISTNTADATGLFQFIDTNAGNAPAKFYILSSP